MCSRSPPPRNLLPLLQVSASYMFSLALGDCFPTYGLNIGFVFHVDCSFPSSGTRFIAYLESHAQQVTKWAIGSLEETWGLGVDVWQWKVTQSDGETSQGTSVWGFPWTMFHDLYQAPCFVSAHGTCLNWQRCCGMENARNLRAKTSECNLQGRMRDLQTCALQITRGLPNPTWSPCSYWSNSGSPDQASLSGALFFSVQTPKTGANLDSDTWANWIMWT